MNRTTDTDVGKLILRLTVAIMMLFHGYAKIIHGVGFVENMLVKNELPAILAYGVYIGEILAPLLLIIGYKTRFSAFIIMCTMVMAIYLVHPQEIFAISKHGAPLLETIYFYIFSCIAIMFLGAGKISVDSK
ncbi:GntR family transcriptional regulator [Malaciobacter halophilus]|uniref:GntR family transcriptional regulator n=1 Tax=Malaciobacter halophilus TaxID=197482 RepID=A0A2N1J3M0_9BACT|nr:DoxX family protein [Malaciobacter halophilus]AXH09121.1 putative membrane protein, DoxX family [Malaciobacter halophilus]PKI81082.1 GntR family transcriptional regulator [Malaciobacter halophilus]